MVSGNILRKKKNVYNIQNLNYFFSCPFLAPELIIPFLLLVSDLPPASLVLVCCFLFFFPVSDFPATVCVFYRSVYSKVIFKMWPFKDIERRSTHEKMNIEKHVQGWRMCMCL